MEPDTVRLTPLGPFQPAQRQKMMSRESFTASCNHYVTLRASLSGSDPPPKDVVTSAWSLPLRVEISRHVELANNIRRFEASTSSAIACGIGQPHKPQAVSVETIDSTRICSINRRKMSVLESFSLRAKNTSSIAIQPTSRNISFRVIQPTSENTSFRVIQPTSEKYKLQSFSLLVKM